MAVRRAHTVLTSSTLIRRRQGQLLRLRESERRFRLIAEQAADLMTMLAPDGARL